MTIEDAELTQPTPIPTPVATRPPFRGPFLVQVARTYALTPLLRRIVLHGEALADFPPDRAGSHIKVLVPRAGQQKPLLPDFGQGRPRWNAPAEARPFLRTYTIRAFDAAARELTLDFVLHAHDGPAAQWARAARPGDYIAVSGPGRASEFPADTAWHLFAGDASALSAISALIERLPATARGIALLEVANADEMIELDHGADVTVSWLLSSAAVAGVSPLVDAVRALELPARTMAFVAGEAATVGVLREHLRVACGLPRAYVDAVPYWKRGAAEEIYHDERHRFMDEDAE